MNAEDEQLRLYATQCLRARRLIEASICFVEIMANPLDKSVGTWDQHKQLREGHEILGGTVVNKALLNRLHPVASDMSPDRVQNHPSGKSPSSCNYAHYGKASAGPLRNRRIWAGKFM